MKTLAALAFSSLLMASSSFATIWTAVNFTSATYLNSSTTKLNPVVENNRSLIAAVVALNPTFNAKQFAVAIEGGTGRVAVILKSNASVAANVLTIQSAVGTVTNQPQTEHIFVDNATVFLPQGTFTSTVFEKTKTTAGNVKLIAADANFSGAFSNNNTSAVVKGQFSVDTKVTYSTP